jgi:hypothetical protein
MDDLALNGGQPVHKASWIPGTVFLAVMLVPFVLMGCRKQADSPRSASPPGNQPPLAATPASEPVLSSVLAIWQQGNWPAAISRFLETDWSQRPLFAPGSALSLGEEDFKKLARADRNATSGEIMSQAGDLKKLAAAVAQAGRDAAAKKDYAQARRHFTALRECGEALDRPANLAIVRLVGQAFKKLANAELAKLE